MCAVDLLHAANLSQCIDKIDIESSCESFYSPYLNLLRAVLCVGNLGEYHAQIVLHISKYPTLSSQIGNTKYDRLYFPKCTHNENLLADYALFSRIHAINSKMRQQYRKCLCEVKFALVTNICQSNLNMVALAFTWETYTMQCDKDSLTRTYNKIDKILITLQLICILIDIC